MYYILLVQPISYCENTIPSWGRELTHSLGCVSIIYVYPLKYKGYHSIHRSRQYDCSYCTDLGAVPVGTCSPVGEVLHLIIPLLEDIFARRIILR